MKLESTRRSIYLWFRLMLSLLYPEWSDDYFEQPWYFSEEFFDSLDPRWHYYMRQGQSVPDPDSDF